MSNKRKTKYHTHVKPNLNKVAGWRKRGFTEKQISQKLGIAYSTFNLYKNEHLELLEALKIGKEELTIELEKTLYQKAMGFEYEETDITEYVDDSGKKKKQVVKKKKRALPDTGALAFALKNLDSERWRDRHEQQIDMKNEVSLSQDAKEFRKYLENEGRAIMEKDNS